MSDTVVDQLEAVVLRDLKPGDIVVFQWRAGAVPGRHEQERAYENLRKWAGIALPGVKFIVLCPGLEVPTVPKAT